MYTHTTFENICLKTVETPFFRAAFLMNTVWIHINLTTPGWEHRSDKSLARTQN